MESFEDNEVVISGVGGLFPRLKNLEDFKNSLLANEELLTSRWPEGERGLSNSLGVVPDIELFDTSFFGIHRYQSLYMDPMQRMTLERTFEALVDAGVAPAEIRGRKIGVYTGSAIGENDSVFYDSIASGFGVTGHSRAMMANRISYWLNLKGPSCSYDSNWTSGFDVLQMAFNAIKAGQVEAAIVATANLALNSEISWIYNDMRMLSKDGKTRAFDEEADGYARSDGFVVFYLQRAKYAKRAYSSIIDVGTQYLGNRPGSYLDIDVPSMVDYLDEFVKKSGIDVNDVEYVEAYGAGIKEIDEAELQTLEQVYCKNRKTPLQIGTVKPNTGHAEASAVMFGICKALIAMQSDIIPATLHYNKPNKNIHALTSGKMNVLTTNTKYNGGIIAVNGLGLSSSIGHILLKPNPKVKKNIVSNLPALVIASTRTEIGMREILDVVKSQPAIDPEYIGLTHSIFENAINGHLYRGFTVLGENTDGFEGIEYFTGSKRQIWFVYSGMGSQWTKMGNDLMQLPLFAESIQKSHNILVPKDIDLINIITSDDPTIFDNILHSFVGIAAIQIALTDILNALGIVPDGIIGHSVGELGCAYGDGALTAEEMILCAYSRGRASLEATLIKGMMAAVGLGYNQIKDMVPPSIEVACHNGPDSSTISGPAEDMEKFVKELQDKGIFARLVNVANIAYHSRYIKPAGPLLLKYLKDVIKTPRLRSPKWVSTSAPESKWNLDEAKYSSAEYHTNNLLGSVLFEEGSKQIPKDSIVIEIAPHGLLQAILKRSLPTGCTNIPLTNRQSKNSLNFLLGAIGKMYLAGLEFNPARIFPKVNYPVSKGTVGLSPLVRWEHGETWKIGIEHKVNFLVGIKEIQMTLNHEDFRDSVGHQLNDNIFLPVTSLLTIILQIFEKNLRTTINQFIFENLKFENYIPVPRMGFTNLFAVFQRGTGQFEVTSDDKVVCSGKLRVPAAGDEFLVDVLPAKLSDDYLVLTGSDIYNEFIHRGHKYTGQYKSIKSIKLMEEGSVTTYNATSNWQSLIEGMLQQVMFQTGENYQNIVVPKFVLRMAIAIDQLPTDKNDIEVSYNYSTGMLYTTGIQITNVKTMPLPSKKVPVFYSSFEFVPFEENAAPNMENIINASFQLTLENFHEPNCTTINVTEIETQNSSLMELIKNALADYVDLNVSLTTVQDTNLHKLISHTDPSLLIINDNINEHVAKHLISSAAFVLGRTNKNILSYNNIVEFARFEHAGTHYSLLRKASTDIPQFVYVKDDFLTAREGVKESSWITDLRTLTKNIKSKVYLVSKVFPMEGITTFTRELRSVEQFKHVRSLFLLDKKAPEFSATNEVYKSIFRKDSMLTLIKEGKVGSYIAVPVNIKVNVRNTVYSSSQMESKTIQILGVNLKDESQNIKDAPKCETGNLDYVCTDKNGEKYIGLAYLEPDTCKFITDPILKWKIPAKYRLEEAATIPHAYTAAYYCLIQKANLKTGDVVFITSGCSPIGLACIVIAYGMGCPVYTTVDTVSQRAFLKKMFYKMRDENIYSSKDTSFEPLFMASTKGLGAKVIVNNMSGSFLQATTRCISELGMFIQFGKYDLVENKSLGMRIFLKYCSFISVNLENIFFIPNEDKKNIQKFIEEGMLTDNVRPLSYKMVTGEKIEDVLNQLRDSAHIGKTLIKVSDDFQVQKLSTDKNSQYLCDTKASYFIYGGSADIWADMVEWLILRGARKIMISSDSKPQQAHISRRLSLLQSYFNADIIYAPNKPMTKDNASELLSEVYYLGPIQAAFILPNKSALTKHSDIKPLQHIELALRNIAPKALLVNFVSLAEGIFHQRLEAGFPTHNVAWNQTLNFKQILYALDDILQLNVKLVQVKFERITDFDEETSQMLYKKLALLLPSPEDIIENLGRQLKELKLVQLPSLGPTEIRAVPPIFMIPGLTNINNLKQLAQKLLFPVFYPKIPFNGMKFSEITKILAEKIRQIYPKGPYNLVAISCGGTLAIEVARILQKTAKTQITFVDAAPDSIQSCLKLLGEGVHGEVNFLTRILNIDNINVIDSLQNLPNWEQRLETALNSSNVSNKAALKKVLNSIKDQLEFIFSYQPSEELIQGKIFLVRPLGSSKFDNSGLLKYCKQAPEITVVNGDHAAMLLHKNFVELINNSVVVK